MNDVSTEENLLRSWSDYKKNIRILSLGTTLIIGASFFVLLGGISFFRQDSTSMLLLAIVFFLLSVVFQIGFIKIVLNITGNKTVHKRLLYTNYHYMVRYTVGLISYFFLVCFGLLLLVVPGVVWAIRYSLWPLAMVNKDFGVLSAFTESSRLTKGSKRNLLWIYLALIGAITLSVVPFGVALIVSYPVGILTCTHVYRRLQIIRTNESLKKHKKKRKEKNSVI